MERVEAGRRRSERCAVRARWAGLALLALYAAFLFPFALARAPGWLPDAYVYLLMAEALSPWGGAASPAAAHVLRSSAFPPLHPLLLGLVGGAEPLAARAFGVTCLLASLVMLFALARLRGRGAGEALALCGVFAALPVTLLQALEGASEPLYLLLGLIGLAAAARAEESASGEGLAAAAVAIGLALATRTAGIALVAAFGVWLFARRAPRRGAWLAVAFGPFALWSLARAAWLRSTGSYGEALRARLASYDPELAPALAKAFADQVSALASAWHSAFAFWPGATTRIAATAVAVLAVAGLARGVRRRDLVALYAAAYLVMIALWPFPPQAARLLWPVLPLLLGFALEVAGAGLERVRPGAGRLAAPGLALLAALLALPSWGVVAERFPAALRSELGDFARTPRWYLVPDLGASEIDAGSRRHLARAMSAVRDLVPAGECIYAVDPLELMWWSRRVAMLPPPSGIAAATFAARSRDCGWFLLSPMVWGPYASPYYPRERLAGELEVVAPLVGAGAGHEPLFLARRRARSDAAGGS